MDNPSASQPNSTLVSSSHGAHGPGPGNNAAEPSSSRSTNPQTQVSDGKAAKQDPDTVILESTSHQGSSFNNINNLEIYHSTFAIENQTVSSFPTM